MAIYVSLKRGIQSTKYGIIWKKKSKWTISFTCVENDSLVINKLYSW